MPTPTVSDPQWKTIAERVQTHLEAITNSGKVFLRERGTKFYSDIMANKVKAGQLNVWEICCGGWTTIIPAAGGGSGNLPLRHRIYKFKIYGHLAYRDGTDDNNSTHQFYQMCEDFEDLIVDDCFLDSNLIVPILTVGVETDWGMYGSIYCHEAEITFDAEVRLNAA